ncbi:unnamed protein product [Calypogeia fissa]
MGASKVLVIGATGYMGKNVVAASAKLGHPTFALVRSATSNDPAKAQVLKAFQEAGVTLVVGDLADHASLVAALKQVDVVISTVGGMQIMDQTKILDAAKEVGTIKRFLPSEFGQDVDRIELDVEITKGLFNAKREIRRLCEKSGIPYTFVASGSYAGYYLAPIVQDLWAPPRAGKLTIFGDGKAKAIFVDEADISTFTVKCVDDPRTENKTLHIMPKENIMSQNEVTAIWEKKIGVTFDKEVLSTEGVLKSIQEMPFPDNLMRAIKYSIFVKGDQTFFTLGEHEVEATALYPDVKYTTVDEYLSRLV